MRRFLATFLLAAVATGHARASSVESDQAQSPVETLQVAAAGGSSAAMYALARRYNSGDGVERDYEQAAALHRKAALAGNREAMLWLGIHDNNGRGVPQDFKLAAAWYLKAAHLGQGSAMFYLGTMHWGGRGVAQDYVEAWKWLDLAAVYGPADEKARNSDTRDLLGRAPQMTPELLAQARQRSADWVRAFEARRK